MRARPDEPREGAGSCGTAEQPHTDPAHPRPESRGCDFSRVGGRHGKSGRVFPDIPRGGNGSREDPEQGGLAGLRELKQGCVQHDTGGVRGA